MRKADLGLIAVTAGLVVFGLVALTSASGPTAFQQSGDTYFYLKRQLLLGVLPGIVLFFVCTKLPIEAYRKIAPWTFPAAFLLLSLGFIPGLAAHYGKGSWVNFGGFSFQPSEPAKLLLIVYFAWWLARRGEEHLKTFWSGFLPFAVTMGIVVGMMMLQSDLGTTAVIIAFLFSMYIAAGAPYRHVAVFVLAAAVFFIIFIKIAPYRADRLKIFLHPELDPQGVGYHVSQARLAIGTGGWFGLGLGNSRQKFLYLPEVTADSIFAIISEELGFFVSAALILAYLYFLWRCLAIAERAPDGFSRSIAVGISTWIVFQAFLNVSAMVGLMPLTGVPLPFISHGGSAMMANLAGAGVLVALSKGEISHRHRG